MNGFRITLAAGVAAAVACTSAVAHADEETGLAVGLRLGYAIPFGDAQSNTVNGTSTNVSMASYQRGWFPFWFDVGYRFTPSIYLGLFYEYGPTFPKSGNCYVYNPGPAAAGEVTCDGFSQRLGLAFNYHIRPHELLDPWVGIGIGWEMAQLNYAQGASADTFSFQTWGPEADLQLGLDLRFSHRIPFGPFVDVSFSEYNTESKYNADIQGSDVAFGDRLHGWVTLGVRAQFDL
jgi:opacity protein-like surface antigen